MSTEKRRCFVIMPFLPELKYMYLYLKGHVEDRHNLVCERGDASYNQVGILDKIERYIRNADVIIADCSGRNPNVMYELGMARILEKPVILITGDSIQTAPADIRSFDFIPYRLDVDDTFMQQLDAALSKVLGTYDDLYDVARKLFHEFRQHAKLQMEEASKETFIQHASTVAKRSVLPDPGNEKEVARQFLLALGMNWDVDMSEKVSEWINLKFPR